MRRQQAVEKAWILSNPVNSFVVKEVEELSITQASRLVNLIKEGCETAYIARYRGDVHGGLPPERIRKAIDAYFDAVDLNKKVGAAITSMTTKIADPNEKKIVTERLLHCEDTDEVAEITNEFSTGTRRTKAKIARDFGLEPHAQDILAGKFVDFKHCLSGDLKEISLVKEHLKICLADMINRDPEVRKMALKICKLEEKCHIQISANLSRDASKNKEQLDKKGLLKKYESYIGHTWWADSIKDHTVSALNRGSEEGVISWKADLNIHNAQKMHPFNKKIADSKMRDFFQIAFNYSINTYFIPMVERGVKRYLTRRSECRSIQIFGQNVEQLFSQQGVRSKYVIALDPGKVVKAAFLEPSGSVIFMDEFPIKGSIFDKRGIELLKNWSSKTNGKNIVFAIGNGSNTHNTQTAVSRMIENKEFPKGIDVCFCIVPEHGASKYSCTTAAREEFGDEAEIKQISAVSIGRRLIDPMSEYVKIEPQHLGKGQYQLSVDDKLLKEKLVAVVRDRVSLIGADLNMASKSLLQSICGLNTSTATEIVKYREKHGRFRSRNELKRVKGIGEITFQQCAGFLTVTRPEASGEPPSKRMKLEIDVPRWSPFDETMLHPDDYEAAIKLLKKLGVDISDISGLSQVVSPKLSVEEQKIMDLLVSKPQLKPPPMLMKKVRVMKDLSPGQRYTGTVSNKTDFGLFVDIGVERDGLVHISNYRSRNVPGRKPENVDELQIPTVGEQIEVMIENIQGDRISLKPV
ncbi:hypothetical protein CAEBREN_28493 [Caenorhabditis brenneri]|uniref:S1 motif domain-containing protein n=1 Tax=Caenorhabditis brenneri TaxID=135651 RepID=G0PBU7_CAEBE|nr:hypothetical protein CAEBREN_28493 [Caenorhabditis brenneri]